MSANPPPLRARSFSESKRGKTFNKTSKKKPLRLIARSRSCSDGENDRMLLGRDVSVGGRLGLDQQEEDDTIVGHGQNRHVEDGDEVYEDRFEDDDDDEYLSTSEDEEEEDELTEKEDNPIILQNDDNGDINASEEPGSPMDNNQTRGSQHKHWWRKKPRRIKKLRLRRRRRRRDRDGVDEAAVSVSGHGGSSVSIDESPGMIEPRKERLRRRPRAEQEGRDDDEGLEGGTGAHPTILNPNGVARPQNKSFDPNWAVRLTEQVMRMLILASGSFMLGVKYGQDRENVVSRVYDYAITAWSTCVIIMFLDYVQRHYPEWHRPNGIKGATGEKRVRKRNKMQRATLEDYPKGERDSYVVPLGMEGSIIDEQKPPVKETAESTLTASRGITNPVAAVAARTTLPVLPKLELPHPTLEPVYITDVMSSQRIIPNSLEPIHVVNEWFDMKMIVMLRTPDVDDATKPKGSLSNQKIADYLRGKQRRFEFQYQVKVKKVPENKALYFSCELNEPIKLGLVQRAFVGAAMAFMRSTNPTFHYSIMGSKEQPDGKYEKPHTAFTVEGTLDRLVISKPGETPPQLGSTIYEDPDSIKRRKKGGPVDWNTEDTYTMALWSAYVDFLEWRVINLPGIRPFQLNSVIGSQCFNMKMYLIDKDLCKNGEKSKHYQKDLTTVASIEISNKAKSEIGIEAKKYEANLGKEALQAQAQAQVKQKVTISEMNAEDDDKDASNNGNILLSESQHADDEEMDQDAVTAAQLGEGIYLRNGDTVVLRQFIANNSNTVEDESMSMEKDEALTVSNGAGFAVVNQHEACEIIIETARNSKQDRLIRSGDTVTFKMKVRKDNEKDVRYLTIHRGWWLKWVTSMPSKNGYFTIHTHESEGARPGGETQSSFLTYGGTFCLKHKRWSNYYIGASAEPSATYGGLLLGLYNPQSSNRRRTADDDEQFRTGEFELLGEDEDNIPDEKEREREGAGKKGIWMNPLILCAHEPASAEDVAVPTLGNGAVDENDAEGAGSGGMYFSKDDSQMDVPAWIEMMDRVNRVRQLTYVVRISQRSGDGMHAVEEGSRDDDSESSLDAASTDSPVFGRCDSLVLENSTVRLRTGRELASIMRVGQSWNNITSPTSSANKRDDFRRGKRAGSSESLGSRNHRDGHTTPPRRDGTLSLSPRTKSSPVQQLPMSLSSQSLDADDLSIESASLDDECASAFDEIESGGVSPDERDSSPEPNQGGSGKSRGLIGKVAKISKTATFATGKTAVKTMVGTGKLTRKVAKETGKLTGNVAVGTGKMSKKVAKGTVYAGKTAGKAVIAPISRKSKKVPKQEPKAKQINKDRRRQFKDMRVVVSRTMRRFERIERKKHRAPTILAGELCAPDQSCRTASRVLSRMSNLPATSLICKKFNAMLLPKLSHQNQEDRWFLRGTAVQLGVVALSGERSRGNLVHESLVAVCMWESHWREEWCGIYNGCISFYAPLTNTPSLEIAYIDIQNVRKISDDTLSPLPCFPLLVLETAWVCRYVAFRDEESRDEFAEKLNGAISKFIREVEENTNMQEHELRRAQIWQGFRETISESSLASGRGKWARISSLQKMKHRNILNSRRMVFDLQEKSLGVDTADGYTFVQKMAKTALSFSRDSLEEDPDTFIEFLDATSQLRSLPLDEVDLSSKQVYCMFINIYHCLLQHALLMSVNGPLTKRSVSHFMRTSCYEIGGDVFSLSELHSCVIRGRMARPVGLKAPYVEAPKKSSPYRFYSLDMNDSRVNFVLNTCDISCPNKVPVLVPDMLDRQLSEYTLLFLKKEMTVDPKRRYVVLPKLCEIYKNDFGSDSRACLRYLMSYLDDETATKVRIMMADESSMVIRYQHTADKYYNSLRLLEQRGIPEQFDVTTL